jgi:hypothetical protein
MQGPVSDPVQVARRVSEGIETLASRFLALTAGYKAGICNHFYSVATFHTWIVRSKPEDANCLPSALNATP